MNQQSDAWHEWRNAGIGSSDAPIIMGVSEFMTPYELWEIKTGIAKREETSNFIQDLGNEIEPIARARYELECDIDMPPILCEHKEFPFLRASMDGGNFEAMRGLEIKYVGVNDFALICDGGIPEKYFPQVMHQFLVTGFKEIDLYGYSVPRDSEKHMGKGKALRCVPDLEYIKKLFDAEVSFWEKVSTKTPPPFIDKDFKLIRTKGAKAIADEYALKNGLDVSDLRDTLLNMCKGVKRARIGRLRIQDEKIHIHQA